MVFEIECSDERGEHVELKADGSARLFSRSAWDDENGAFTVSSRQLAILKELIAADALLRERAKDAK
jgi:hypothetical protein